MGRTATNASRPNMGDRMKIDKYDKIFSQVVREAADWECEICHRSNIRMECSHDRSRRYVLTRYDPRNAICSCSGCHRRTTESADDHVESFRRIKGSEVRQLMRELSNSRGRLKKFEREAIHKHYKRELGRIKALRMNGKVGKIEVEVPEVLL